MKVIIPQGDTAPRFTPGRKFKRDLAKRLSKSSHQKVTKADVENYILLQRLKSGNVTDAEIKEMAGDNVNHYDNVDVFPDGTEVKLNYDAIMSRKADLTEKFIGWIEENKDNSFHLLREDSNAGLVSLLEDQRFYEDEKTKEVRQEPRWFFDLFSDLLVSNGNGEFVDPWTIEGASGDFVNLADGLNEAVNDEEKEPLFAPAVVFEEKE